MPLVHFSLTVRDKGFLPDSKSPAIVQPECSVRNGLDDFITNNCKIWPISTFGSCSDSMALSVPKQQIV